MALMPVCVAAADMERTSMHHGRIFVDVPKDLELWKYDEYDIMYFSKYCVNSVFTLDNEDTDFHIFFDYVLSDDYMFDEVRNKRTANQMFNAEVDKIEYVLEEQYGVGLYDDSKKYIKSSSNSDNWLRLRCEYEEEYDTYVYVNETNSKAIRMFLVRNNNGDEISKEQLELADAVVTSFHDKASYIDELYTYYDPNHVELDPIYICLCLFVFVISIFLKLLVHSKKDIKLANKNDKGHIPAYNYSTVFRETEEIQENQDEQDIEYYEEDEEFNKNEENNIEEESIDSESLEQEAVQDEEGVEQYIGEVDSRPKESMTKVKNQKVNLIDKKLVRTNDNEIETVKYPCTYEEGLKELYKSGILTKKELDEMLRKYYSKKGGQR